MSQHAATTWSLIFLPNGASHHRGRRIWRSFLSTLALPPFLFVCLSFWLYQPVCVSLSVCVFVSVSHCLCYLPNLAGNLQQARETWRLFLSPCLSALVPVCLHLLVFVSLCVCLFISPPHLPQRVCVCVCVCVSVCMWRERERVGERERERERERVPDRI